MLNKLLKELKAINEDYKVEMPNDLTQLMTEINHKTATWIEKLLSIQKDMVRKDDYRDNSSVFFIKEIIDKAGDLQDSCQLRKD